MNSRSKRLLTFAAVSSGLILLAVTASRGQADKSPASVPQAAVLARLAEIQKAAEALDADRVFSFVLENKSGAAVQNGRFFLTREEALESTKRGLGALQKVEYQFDQQHVTLLSPTVALAVGEGSSTATTADGRGITTRFAQSVVLVQTNGEWKVFHSHRSFPPVR